MNQETRMVKFDLAQYESKVFSDLNSHLAEITSFLRSVFMAVENFPPDNIEDVTVLPVVLGRPGEIEEKLVIWISHNEEDFNI